VWALSFTGDGMCVGRWLSSDLSTCVPDAGKSHAGKNFGIEILGRLNCRIHTVLWYLAWVLRRNLLVIYLGIYLFQLPR